MQLQAKIDDLGFCPSFSCYFSDSLTATAAAKVSREFNQEYAAQFHNVDEADFEFSLEFSDAEVSHKHTQHFVFPVFDSALLTNRKLDLKVEEIGDTSSSSSIRIQLHKLDVDELEDTSSSSSSEADELEGKCSGIFCMWRLKSDVVSSSPLRDCKKSNSTGSRSHGSERWRRIRNLLRRSNSDGEFLLQSKKIEATKQKHNIDSENGAKVAGDFMTTASSPSFHELFYMQKRAHQKGYKTKSFLPYRQDLLGLFVNINRIRNKKSQF